MSTLGDMPLNQPLVTPTDLEAALDPPAPKIPIHQNGTVVYDGLTVVDQAWVTAAMALDNSAHTIRYRGGGFPYSYTFVVLLPETYLIEDYYFAHNVPDGGGPVQFEYSTDATNGVDGTWTGISLTSYANDDVPTQHEAHKTSLDVPFAAKAIRITYDTGWSYSGFRAFHLYGTTTLPEYATPEYVNEAIADTQDGLDAHVADTTSVHGIANTADLATTAQVAAALNAIGTSSGWAVDAVFTELKTFDPNDTTPSEIARVLGTLVVALKADGLLGGA